MAKAKLKPTRENTTPVWESVGFYRRIVESARDFAIFTVDLKNRVTSWNAGAERLLGFSERDAMGMSAAEIFTPEDRAKKAPEKEIAAARRHGNAEDERWHIRKNRSLFWGSGLMMRLQDDADRHIGYVKILRDLTDRKTAADALKELNHTLEQRVRDRTAELEDSHRQLRELARQLTRTERMERERIAADLHDNLGQLLAFAQMRLAVITSCVSAPEAIVEPARELREYLDEAIAYTRMLMSNLSPPGLGRGDFVASLKWLAADMARHDLKVSLADDKKRKVVSPDMQAVLFQAVRELLYNVRKHAGVTKASVRISRLTDVVRVEVIDDGVGFGNAKSADESRGGFGLFHVSERLKLFGGSLEVDRKRKRGTKIIVTAPLASARRL